jgi:hypothetical protein
MPYHLACPRCGKRGYVRAERIIAKAEAHTHYFCGHCMHEWDDPDPPPAHDPSETTERN